LTTVVVAAAIIQREDCFLLTRRQPGVHLAGYWEFPGGKCEPGETDSQCLTRELREELAVTASIGGLVLSTRHTYPDREVELRFFRCRIEGNPDPQLGQEMRWVPREELSALPFPPADAELIRKLTTLDSER
jgi:8-oxo-dGTP diphosphatase